MSLALYSPRVRSSDLLEGAISMITSSAGLSVDAPELCPLISIGRYRRDAGAFGHASVCSSPFKQDEKGVGISSEMRVGGVAPLASTTRCAVREVDSGMKCTHFKMVASKCCPAKSPPTFSPHSFTTASCVRPFAFAKASSYLGIWLAHPLASSTNEMTS